MTLSEAQIERYSRQILLPEVGGLGQARLLAARVLLVGTGPAAEAAALLLGRAGVGALDLVGASGPLPELSPDCRVGRWGAAAAVPAADVVVDVGGGEAAALARGAQAGRPFVVGVPETTSLRVATLVGRPCAACVDGLGTACDGGGAPFAAPASQALGALGAGEALRVLLTAPTRGRLTSLDLVSGAAHAAEIAPTAGCAACRGRP